MEQNPQILPPEFNPQQPQQPAGPQYQPQVTERPMMNPIESITTCLKKYAIFKGRARRSEFWWFMLFIFVIQIALSFLSLVAPAVGYVSIIISLLLLLPQWGVLTRRLHDSGHSGWWIIATMLLCLVYYGIFLYVMGGNPAALSSNPADAMAVGQSFAESIQQHPGLATVMFFSAIGTLVLFLITLVFALQDSKWETNKYGPSPKYNNSL